MHEILTLQVGQCGNQIGNEFWRKIMDEHSAYETNENTCSYTGRKDRFFYFNSDNLIPRTILIDTEPRAISDVISTNSNVFIANEGTGAGNNWAHGHFIGTQSKEEILDMINRHVEACDSMESIYMFHSTAGGTGSGFGSFLAQELRDLYPKTILSSFSILPNNNESSEVVVQPYNTVLTLNSLYRNMNNVILMDNGAMGAQLMGNKILNFDSINSIAADVISAYSSPVRFPKHMYCDSRSFLNCVVPIPDFKFIIPSYVKNNHISTPEIMSSLTKQKSMLCFFERSSVYSYFSIMNVLDSKNDRKSITRSTKILQNRLSFVDLPFYLTTVSSTVGADVAFNNFTAVKSVFRKITGQFDKLRKRDAFLEIYRKYDLGIEEMDEARMKIGEVGEKYERAEVNLI